MQLPVFGRAFLVYVIRLVGSALWCTVTLVCVRPLLGSPCACLFRHLLTTKLKLNPSFTKVLLGGINCSVGIFVELSVGGNITMWDPVQRKLLEGGMGSGFFKWPWMFQALPFSQHDMEILIISPWPPCTILKIIRKIIVMDERISLREQCNIYSSSVICVICIPLEFSSVVSYKKKLRSFF